MQYITNFDIVLVINFIVITNVVFQRTNPNITNITTTKDTFYI